MISPSPHPTSHIRPQASREKAGIKVTTTEEGKVWSQARSPKEQQNPKTNPDGEYQALAQFKLTPIMSKIREAHHAKKAPLFLQISSKNSDHLTRDHDAWGLTVEVKILWQGLDDINTLQPGPIPANIKWPET